jgi:hypothetical protein
MTNKMDEDFKLYGVQGVDSMTPVRDEGILSLPDVPLKMSNAGAGNSVVQFADPEH